LNLLKRSAWDHDDLPASKRRHSVMSPDDGVGIANGLVAKNERRPSVDFAAGNTTPLESGTRSAYLRSRSPAMFTQPNRNPPSPSSLACPPSAAPSVVPRATQSLGSPATSYQPSVSIHTASTSSATSAHIADLQHQVTLKSLSLSTLQSEYSSLLQKLQRERLKSQAIEKKTSVADQEVNDLTGRNEELIDQVKSLETQLEASEKKRESERAEAVREKDQWGRMLELGGRIQTKHAEEKQKLRDENQSLAQRVATYEGGKPGGIVGLQVNPITRVSPFDQDLERAYDTGRQDLVQRLDARYTRNDLPSTSNSTDLKRENEILISRIENLRFSLEEARRHNQLSDERIREVLTRSEQIGSVVRRALEDEDDRAVPGRQPYATEGNGPAMILDARSAPGTLSRRGSTYQHQSLSVPSSEAHSRKVSQQSTDSSRTLASLARAVSPGPAELGFHVTPSTSSPEEIIKALGPVPAPLPCNEYGTPLDIPRLSSSKKQGRSKQPNQQRRQSTDAVSSWLMPQMTEQHSNIGSFRPLSQHPFPTPTGFNGFRLAEHDTSPHSHHSSPGPARDERSPSSTSSAEGKVRLPSLSAVDHRRSSDFGRPFHTEHSSAMPPPPRPALFAEPFIASHQRST